MAPLMYLSFRKVLLLSLVIMFLFSTLLLSACSEPQFESSSESLGTRKMLEVEKVQNQPKKIKPTNSLSSKNQTKLIKPTLSSSKNQTKLIKSSLSSKNQTKLLKPNLSFKNQTKLIKSSSNSTKTSSSPTKNIELKKLNSTSKSSNSVKPNSISTNLDSRFRENLNHFKDLSQQSQQANDKPVQAHCWQQICCHNCLHSLLCLPLDPSALSLSPLQPHQSLFLSPEALDLHPSLPLHLLLHPLPLLPRNWARALKFFYATSQSTYVCLQVLQTLGYVLYLLLLLMYLILVFSTDSGLGSKMLGLGQTFVGLSVGLHYYMSVFHRAVLRQPPKTNWKVHGIYATCYLVICLFATVERRKKAYLEEGGEEGKKS
ncbi:unnamed protein product [Prunus armeniaca]|uniref:Uncharacterized protein n=1 Tax=Prunus armeniaca TaxID=36596 RepID=A0A6J5XKD1_PRUAR|nr:unnamed protein product [Prunus armeniaca]